MKTASLFLLFAFWNVGTPAADPRSVNYVLSDFAFGAGGHSALSSPGYQATLLGIGAEAAEEGLGSLFYSAAGGFHASYPPPGEVLGVRFADRDTLSWDPDPSAGRYNVYREVLIRPPSGYGNCVQAGADGTIAVDPAWPDPGLAYVYLITAENRLNEEGTKGYGSSGLERPNPDPCP